MSDTVALANTLSILKEAGLLLRAGRIKVGDVDIVLDGAPAPEERPRTKEESKREEELLLRQVEDTMYGASQGYVPPV